MLSCHDISDGGVSTALSEMSFKNEIGCDININCDLSKEKILFTETGGFLLEVSSKSMNLIKKIFLRRSTPFYNIGKTTAKKFIKINESILLPIRKAKIVWENGLREKL